MDVFGIHPIAERGKYFRNSIWYWHPLWEFVCESCANVLSDRDQEEGHWNNGHSIDSATARAIGGKLRELLTNGTAARVAKKYEMDVGDTAVSSCFSEENVREFADFCLTSGGFRIC